RLIPELVKIERTFEGTRKLLAGETMTIDWVPGTGTVITVKGKAQGSPFNDVEVFNVLLGIWIGPSAADWKLRDDLLGKMP
ncbi:MAG: chalcone isomerase family protein, partial [Polaromonas sp.]|nr:chalcone isomerase family protein [Polaromonas sp.]